MTEELRELRDRIDRACMVVAAVSCIPIPKSWETQDIINEYNGSLDELLALRARERELTAGPANDEQALDALVVDAINKARAEGIAQGRRELAREALARGGGLSEAAHIAIVEFLAGEVAK